MPPKTKKVVNTKNTGNKDNKSKEKRNESKTRKEEETENSHSSSSSDTDPNESDLDDNATKICNALLKFNPGVDKKTAITNEHLLNAILQLTNNVTDLDKKLSDSIAENKALQQRVDHVEKKYDYLIKKYCNMEDNLDEMDQQHRQNKIIVQCPTINNQSSPRENVIHNMETHLKIPKTKLDNISVSKLGSTNKFLVTLPYFELKGEIFKASKQLKPRGMYINEFLTEKRAKLFYECRMKKRNENCFSSVYTFNGRVYVKVDGGPSQWIKYLNT